MIKPTLIAVLLAVQTLELFAAPAFPFAPPAGQAGTTAVSMESSNIVAWADGYTNLSYGEDVSPDWMTPEKALGQAIGDSYHIVSLGRSGEITLSFSQGITDGNGYDFAVFENGVSDGFLELAWVEVSSDGIHFTRFPNISYTANPVGTYETVDATYIYGYAGKYRQGFGTPFDLSELHTITNEIALGNHSYSEEFVSSFSSNFPHLDFSLVTYVKIIDVDGDGSSKDAEGLEIYDPYKTFGSAGFDLDAVAVLNQPINDRIPQSILFTDIPHQKLGFQTLELSAKADSGLPVIFSVLNGPVDLAGDVLTFTGTGVVEMVANQPGDSVYAPATPALRSFRIAAALQHIFVEPVPDQLMGGADIQVRAYSSSGLPVQMQVRSGPDSVWIGEDSHLLDLGETESGSVTLRAFQSGDTVHAPADDVLVEFQILENGALVEFSDWLRTNAVPNPIFQTLEDSRGRPVVTLEYPIDSGLKASSRVLQSADLVSWTKAVPEILEMSSNHLLVRLLAEETNCFYRLEFEGQ